MGAMAAYATKKVIFGSLFDFQPEGVCVTLEIRVAYALTRGSDRRTCAKISVSLASLVGFGQLVSKLMDQQEQSWPDR